MTREIFRDRRGQYNKVLIEERKDFCEAEDWYGTRMVSIIGRIEWYGLCNNDTFDLLGFWK
jgi:hypothetical protein